MTSVSEQVIPVSSLDGILSPAAMSNDIDRSGAVAAGRAGGVETRGCPHTTIREDASIDLAAIALEPPGTLWCFQAHRQSPIFVFLKKMRAKFLELDLAL
jgi:hypothetical protein